MCRTNSADDAIFREVLCRKLAYWSRSKHSRLAIRKCEDTQLYIAFFNNPEGSDCVALTAHYDGACGDWEYSSATARQVVSTKTATSKSNGVE
jgi:hypothetical protein